jgi:protein TonB
MVGVLIVTLKPLFMQLNEIKEAHFLDILFDGRNKEYGAYELRKTYNRRMVKAMIVMGSVVVMICVGGAVMGFGKGVRVRGPLIEDSVNLRVVIDPPPPTPPPPRVLPPQVPTLRMTTLQIVPDKDVKPDEKPPENDAAINMKIGATNVAGNGDVDVVGPPSNGTIAGVVEAPKKEEDDGPVLIVEIDASFPGGIAAWARFMNKNLRYPEEAMSQGIGGTVVVQFVVDLDGNVSDVKAISGPETGGMREEAERVIRKSGKWVPAVQNGRHVKAYRKQPVTFQPAVEN